MQHIHFRNTHFSKNILIKEHTTYKFLILCFLKIEHVNENKKEGGDVPLLHLTLFRQLIFRLEGIVMKRNIKLTYEQFNKTHPNLIYFDDCHRLRTELEI